MIQSGLKGNKW